MSVKRDSSLFKEVRFNNPNQPNSKIDILKLEELFKKNLDLEIGNIHKIDFYLVLLITEGKGYHTIDFTDHAYSPKTLITVRKDQLQKFDVNLNSKGYILLFTEEFLTGHFSQVEVSRSIQLFNDLLLMPKVKLLDSEFQDIVTIIKDIEREYKESYDEFTASIIRSVIHVLINKLFRLKSLKDEAPLNKKYFAEFTDFQKLVEKHCFETRQVSMYADKMNCSTKTLNNITRSLVRKSAKAVIDEVVITQIKRLLINTTLSIKEIAFKAGFDEPTNMFKYFKKHTSTTPELFRKAN